MTTVMTCVDILIIVDLKLRHHTDHYNNFFIHRDYKIWNNLPESIVNATSTTQFKCKLKKFNLHRFLP